MTFPLAVSCIFTDNGNEFKPQRGDMLVVMMMKRVIKSPIGATRKIKYNKNLLTYRPAGAKNEIYTFFLPTYCPDGAQPDFYNEDTNYEDDKYTNYCYPKSFPLILNSKSSQNQKQ